MVFCKGSKIVAFSILMYTTSAFASHTEEKEIICLANNIYFESRNQPIKGKRAVGEVVINRVASKKFPNTICTVVTQRKTNICQFTWYCKENVYKIITDFSSYEEALEIAYVLYHGSTKNITQGALWYHADYIKPPGWTKSMRVTAHIGNHIFYVEKFKE